MSTNQQDPENSSDAAFARSAIGGKKTAKAEARIADETKFALTRRCHELGMTESDYLDRLLCINLFGLDHVLSVERLRTEKVMGLSAGLPHGALIMPIGPAGAGR